MLKDKGRAMILGTHTWEEAGQVCREVRFNEIPVTVGLRGCIPRQLPLGEGILY